MVTPVPVSAYAPTLAVDCNERSLRSVLAMTAPDLRDESPLHTRRLYKRLTALNGERSRVSWYPRGWPTLPTLVA